MRAVCCDTHSGENSTSDAVALCPGPGRGKAILLWVHQRCERQNRNLDERTIDFSWGQYFGGTPGESPNQNGMIPGFDEASNVQKLSVRDTGPTLGVLW